MVLMIISLSVTYLYVEKFTSVVYFSRGLKIDNTMESLAKSEKMLVNAISLDKNDIYYRTLSQVYVAEINILVSDKSISSDSLKSSIQQLINYAQSAGTLAVNQNPKQYLNYVNLGNIYASLIPLSVDNSYESAKSSYSKAQALAPNNPSIILSEAQLEISKNNNSAARDLIQQSLNLKPDYTDALLLLSQIDTNEGNTIDAINQIVKASQLSPNDATIFFRLGLLRYNSNDYTNAIGAFEHAVILDTSYLNARYFLGLSYQRVGRIGDALIQFKILNKVLPDNQDIKNAIDNVSNQVINTTPVVPVPDNTIKGKIQNKLPIKGN